MNEAFKRIVNAETTEKGRTLIRWATQGDADSIVLELAFKELWK